MHVLEGGLQSGVFGCTKVFCDFATQYCELHDETTRNGKSANAAVRCVKNQLLTRSGRLCGDKAVFEYFGKIVVANPKKSNFENSFGESSYFQLLFRMAQ